MLRSILSHVSLLMVSLERIFIDVILFTSSSIRGYGDPIAAARREVANKETPTETMGSSIANEESSPDRMHEIPL